MTPLPRILSLIAFALMVAAAMPAHADKPRVEALYQKWLQNDLWPQAARRGVSERTFQEAFRGVRLNWKLPDLVPPGEKPKTPKKQHQAEFGSPSKYFGANIVGAAAKGGRARANRMVGTLSAIELAHGVPGRILLAIWGRESGYGAAKIPYNAFEVLGTKAFMSTRKDMFAEEVLSALVMVEKGLARPEQMKSSWAGALGQPQFMPSSYLKHAADGDGDRRADIWTSQADTLASIANYLKHYGWQKGRDWGYEVALPANISCTLEGPDQGKAFAEWAAMGVRRINGKDFPASEMRGQGFLMLPAGRKGPAFLVTPNFNVIKEYNESDLYALFVGHVGDRIQWNAGDFTAPWQPQDKMWRSDIASMQRALEKQGHDVGGADGLPGYKTRRSIGRWQEANGRAATCFPDAGLLKAIR
ncbi:MAG: lytic murein transglycosylase [Notoacmeibacter sp.]|nr:lytic murein transglycosylase [Notoacmeibacter sp.]